MTTLHIPDMSCGHCSGVITRTIAALDPAATVQFNMERHLAEVRSTLPLNQLLPALADAGYPATLSEN
jgi:copper chaperone